MSSRIPFGRAGEKKAKVLFVNDEPFFSDSIIELLTVFGKFDVAYAKSVEEALGYARENNFELVMADVMMPSGPFNPVETRSGRATGIVLIPKLREYMPECKFIVMTIAPDRDIIEHLRREKNVVYVGTPPEWKDLIRLARRTLKIQTVEPEIFIVHGHDMATVWELKDYLRTVLKLDGAIVLRDQPMRGLTMIEKFEEYATRADVVFVVLSPDDLGQSRQREEQPQGRARQNVIFEMGYFCGARGRQSGRMIFLKKGELETPSDLAGIGFIDTSNGVAAAGEEIRRELGDWLILAESGT